MVSVIAPADEIGPVAPVGTSLLGARSTVERGAGSAQGSQECSIPGYYGDEVPRFLAPQPLLQKEFTMPNASLAGVSDSGSTTDTEAGSAITAVPDEARSDGALRGDNAKGLSGSSATLKAGGAMDGWVGMNLCRATSDLQRGVLQQLRARAIEASALARPSLLKRAERLGYMSHQVDACLDYIRERAPILIHFSLYSLVAPFAEDRCYRSAFELKRYESDYMQRRREAESSLFAGGYDSAPPSERVKYGTLNLLGDPAGNKHCHPYGRSMFILRDELRNRVTWTAYDSFCAGIVPGTLDACAHVLQQLLEPDLLLLLKSYGRAADSSLFANYCECQIHGEVRFDRDVRAIVPSQFESSNDSIVTTFARRNSINHLPPIS